MMFKTIIAASMFVLTPVAAFAADAAPAKPSTITAPMPAPDDRARQWLTLVDDANYAQSWNEAGGAFKKGVAADAWARQAAAMRDPLGAMASRDLKNVDLSRSQTAVVRYDTSFAHKTGAVETVILSFEKGAWSVTGYNVK
jgi:Protein of unknown function (DUF4019)